MSTARTLATARRVLMQLRHDPRTIALLLLVPCVLETLLRFIFENDPRAFDSAGAPLLAIFALQASLASALTLGPLGLHISGPDVLVVLLAICVALLGLGLAGAGTLQRRTG